jgi:hypothetical protein
MRKAGCSKYNADHAIFGENRGKKDAPGYLIYGVFSAPPYNILYVLEKMNIFL